MKKNGSKLIGLIICLVILGITVPVGLFTKVFSVEELGNISVDFSAILKLIIMIAAVMAIERLIGFLLGIPKPENHRACSILTIVQSLLKYVAGLVKYSASGFMNFLPCIIFLIAVFLSFATGTSWGTFGILIPIVVHVFENGDYRMMIIAMSACMAGAVCGDHCSPISDTTIMSSAGAQCNHLNHVTTQLPYAMTCAAVSFVTYIIAGLTKSAGISLPCGLVILLAVLLLMKKRQKKAAA